MRSGQVDAMIAIISQSSPLIAQLAARVALLAGFILLTLASTGEWVPVQVLTAGMLCWSSVLHDS